MNKAIEKESLMERVDDDLELLVDLVEIYEEDAAEHLGTIKTAVSSKDGELLTRAAHSLKGSSYNMSANILADLAQELELAGRAGKFEGCQEVADKLDGEFARVMQELKVIIS